MADGQPSSTRVLFFCLFLLFSGCLETGIQLVSSSPPPLPFEELKQKISEIRGLAFQHDVYLETKRTGEISALLEKSFFSEHGNGKLQEVQQVYTRLGLLEGTADFAKGLMDLYLFQQVVHYDSWKRKIIIPRGPLKPSHASLRSPWAMTEDLIKQLLLIRGLTHALQEQHFGWENKLREMNTEDRRLAFQAVVQGDATLVSLFHLSGGPNKQKILDGIQGLASQEAQIEKELSYLPELLRQKAGFTYIKGSQFVMWAYSLKGWEGVNRLFLDPPLSTEQILHPEKYYVKRDNPIRIIPWNLIRRFGGNKIIDETLGEFFIQFLLGRTLPKEEAVRAASGWSGDSLLAFRSGKNLVVSWLTAWDDREEALEFYRSYRKVLEKRYGLSLEPSAAGNDVLITPPRSSHSLLLQLKGNLVLFLDGVPEPRSVEMAEELWQELEISPAPKEIPFELAHRRRHSPTAMR